MHADSLGSVKHFKVEELDPLFSDGHSLLHLNIETCDMHSKSRVDRTNSQKQTLWNDYRKSEFVANLDKEMIKNTLTSLNAMREQEEISQEQIDIAVHKISDMFNKAAKITFKQKTPKYKRDEKDKSWFGKACNEARSEYHTAKKKYKKYPSQMNKNILHERSKGYKNTMNKYINENQFKMKQKLRDLHSSKPKDFWKLINKNANSQESEDLDINTFYEYCRFGNVREHLIFANIREFVVSRIQSPR